MLVDLAAGTVFDEEAAEDSEATHPEDLTVIKECQYRIALSIEPKITRNQICRPDCLQLQAVSIHSPWHSRILRTLPLAKSAMSTNPPRSCQSPSSSTRVHCDGFANDEAILNKLANGLARIGV